MNQQAPSDRPYVMSINLSVLNHLGIGLYSNIPAVLSEVVANSWDADATKVEIEIDSLNDRIVISDNGDGMKREDVNNKYLSVGYYRRNSDPVVTKKNRHVMGRKGIGKLSVFSIARFVEVHTAKDGEVSRLLLDRENIKKLIEDGTTRDYRPEPLDVLEPKIKEGTTIILRSLDRGLSMTESFLRPKLARRFSIIGSEHDFTVSINGVPLTVKDRGFYDRIEFLWYFGKESMDVVKNCKKGTDKIQLDNEIDVQGEKYKVKGWIGTVDERKGLADQDNSIVVFAQGKLIQEDVLKDLGEGGVYSKYIIGEIDADFMDADDKTDLVTSDRQRVKEDDPRYLALKEFIRSALKKIEGKWTQLRNDKGAERALENPVLKEWYDRQKGDNKKYARKLFGKLESLKLPDPKSKSELYKANLLAFEKMALKNTLSVLDHVETDRELDIIARLFESIDELEATHYYEIVKSRLEVIKKFSGIVPDKKEKVIQRYIFDHLWLLDPSWERAATDPIIEQAVTKEFDAINADLSEEERKGRIDIRYKTAAGKHIIVELKKYSVMADVNDLLKQVRKYKRALEKCLREKFQEEKPHIECICLLGKPPGPKDQAEENDRLLEAAHARYITYDELIRRALGSYGEYLEKQKSVSELIAIIDKL